MGASICIFGVDYKKLAEDHPGYFKNSKNISVEELQNLYYGSLYEKVYAGIDCGLERLFGNWIKKYCFTINEMMCYFFSSFSWDDEMNVENYEAGYKFTKGQLIDLMDWYIALTYVLASDKDGIAEMKEPKYLEEAKRMIAYYEDESDQENYFKIYQCDFAALKDEVLNTHYDCYYYTYSF